MHYYFFICIAAAAQRQNAQNMFQRLLSHILPGQEVPQQQQQQQQSHETSDVNTIMDMGFTEEQARNALLISSNDVRQALEYLLQSLPSSPVQQQSFSTMTLNFPTVEAGDPNEEEQLQRALQESMLTERSSSKTDSNNNNLNTIRNNQGKKPKPKNGKISASSIPMAGNRAGQAALERLEKQKQYGTKANANSTNGTTTALKKSSFGNRTERPTHKTKVPLPLSSKTKEEQILRSVSRMSPYPKAIDTMLHAIRMLQEDSSVNSKFRQIDKSSPGYQQALEGVPGVTDLLNVLNFELISNKWILPSHRAIDKALLWLTTSSLEQVRATNPDYHKAKQKIEFIRQVQNILDNANGSSGGEKISEEERRARVVHKNLCPSEPADGALHTIIVSIVLATSHIKKKQEEEYDIINNNTVGTTKTILSRRFHSDDTMRDVLHWLGGHATEIPTKLQQREWCLRDKNRYPALPISCSEEADLNKTLHSVGCWPAGLLELDLSDDGWKQSGNTI